MVIYKCPNCKNDIEGEQVRRRVICPHCGSRVIMKSRPKTIKKVKAR